MQKQIATGFVVLSFMLPLKAAAADFTQMYVFSDSLSDVNNLFNVTGNQVPSSRIYYPGRFSNGSVWVEYLADDLDLNPASYTELAFGADFTDGINFAFGGANTGFDNFGGPGLPGLRQQLTLFNNLNLAPDPNALHIVWAGTNDYILTKTTNTSAVVENVSTVVKSLADAGAKNILVGNLPDLGMLPAIRNRQNSSLLSNLTKEHNSKLAASLNSLPQMLDPDVNLFTLDAYSLFNQWLANPTEFGFTNVTEACFVEVPPFNLSPVSYNECDHPDEYVFWEQTSFIEEENHPTTAAHRLIADSALSTLSIPEPANELGLLALGALGGVSMLKRKQKKS